MYFQKDSATPKAVEFIIQNILCEYLTILYNQKIGKKLNKIKRDSWTYTKLKL